MAGDAGARQGASPVIRDGDGDESDCSIVSTIDNDNSDQEYEVDDVVAVNDRYPTENGGFETRFLVLWTGYDMGAGTWEPEENLNPELIQQWEERKARQKRGEEPEFDEQEWETAKAKLEQAQLERHHRRNAARRRRGLPPTAPIKEEKEKNEEQEKEHDPVLDSEAHSESSDEAFEDNTIVDKEDDVRPLSTPTTAVVPVRRPGMFKGLPHEESTVSNRSKTHENTRRKSAAIAPFTTSSTNKRPAPQPKPLSHPRHEPSSTTGYQGTARKSSSTHMVKPPQISTQSRSSFAAKFGGKTLTAKRSAKPALSTGKPFTGNVFSGGKTRRPRQKLGSVMVDPNKDPKHFPNHRITRIAELQSRSKADQAPDISLLRGKLFNPAEGPPSKKTSHDLTNPGVLSENHSSSSPIDAYEETQGNGGRTGLSGQPAASTESSPSKANKPPRRKPQKSVRFQSILEDGNSDFVAEPMQIDIDTPSTARDDMSPQDPIIPSVGEGPGLSHNSVTLHRNSSLGIGDSSDRLSLSMSEPVPVRSIGKRIVLGPGQATVNVTFNGLPGETTLPWLSKFISQDKLYIGHQCFAKTVIDQINVLRSESLCNGTITSDDPVVDQIADHLRLSLSGLYCSQHDYSLIIYPTKCEDWKSDALEAEPSSPDGVVLMYSLYISPPWLTSFLRPALEPAAVPVPGNWKAEHSVREQLFQQFFGLQYRSLFTSVSKSNILEETIPNNQHVFYLAFPLAKHELYQSAVAWLRDSNPECRIYTGYQEGAWNAFLEARKDEKRVVMVHEALVWTIRHFPDFHKVLRDFGSKINIWCFSESMQNRPLFASQSSAPALPGTIDLTRLFPRGFAILVTPSFMVSEPHKTRVIFEWYFQKRTVDQASKLVTAWNIQDYLLDLALEKSEQRTNLTATQRGSEETLSGLTKQECDIRFQTAARVSDEIALLEERARPLSDNEPIIYADECIDANDEQSLVNWFGWWSILRSHRHRYFFVIGSETATLKAASKRGSRQLRIPRYLQSCNNDPDYTEKEHERSSANMLHELQTGLQFRSVILHDNDNAVLLSEKLYGLDKANLSPLKLYSFPVSWANLAMADHFGDPKGSFSRIQVWYNGALPRNKYTVGISQSVNTLVGFFYTIPGEWDPSFFSPGQKPRRHPWIAIYRPVDVHIKPYKKSELIIWDVSAKERFGDRDHIREGDLSYMQRQVIQFIREHGMEKNPDTPFHQAFLGGFYSPESESSFPMDKTLTFLERLLYKFSTELPGSERHLLPLGYKKIILGESSPDNISRGPHQVPPTQGDGMMDQPEAMDIDQPEDSTRDGQNEVIIFHPPRGTQSSSREPTGPSKCQNHLFEHARLARLRNRNATMMEYRYMSTMEWYEEQKAEGRGFEHILVGEADTVFRALEVK